MDCIVGHSRIGLMFPWVGGFLRRPPDPNRSSRGERAKPTIFSEFLSLALAHEWVRIEPALRIVGAGWEN